MTFPAMKTATLSLAAAALCALATALGAVRTETITVQGYEALAEGELEGVALSEAGILGLAPALEEVAEIGPPLVWTAVTAPKEEAVYLGTGSPGAVWKVDLPSGEASAVFESEEVLVRALAVDGKGRLYIGTSPYGRIYRLTPGNRPEVFHDPDAAYLWELVFSEDGKTLYAATGSPAAILAIPLDNPDAAESLFSARQTHLTALARQGGTLYAGTSPEGVVYRVDTGSGEAFGLYNTGQEEIRALLPQDDGTVLVSTFNSSGGGSGARPQGPSGKDGSTGGNSSGNGSASQGGSNGTNGTGGENMLPVYQVQSTAGGTGPLFRLDREGFARVWWHRPQENILSLHALGSDQWLAGSDTEGRLYRLEEDGERWALWQQAPEGEEISSLFAGKDGKTYVVTSNPARLYRLGETPAAGTYESKVFSTTQTARWGTFRADTGEDAPFTLGARARGGNAEEPDATWTDWQEVVPGSELGLPGARYVQLELTLSPTDGRKAAAVPQEGVRRLRLFHALPNAAPEVQQVRVVPQGYELIQTTANQNTIDPDRLLSAPAGEVPGQEFTRTVLRERPAPGLYTVVWKASDANGDRLRYTVRLLQNGTAFTLASDLEDTLATLPTDGLPDGLYRAEVVASDAPDNQPGEAESGRRLSDYFLIDNTAPQLSGGAPSVRASTATLTVTASDAASVVSAASYVLNGAEAVPLRPEDGLFDEQEETFALTLEKLPAGRHSLLVEVADEAGNTRVLPVDFTVKD